MFANSTSPPCYLSWHHTFFFFKYLEWHNTQSGSLPRPLCSHKCKPHLQWECSCIALANSTAPPNAIKQALHISSLPLPLSPLFCARVLQQMVHTMGFSPQGHRGPRSASAVERGQLPPCSPVPCTCLGLDMSPQVPRAEELGRSC